MKLKILVSILSITAPLLLSGCSSDSSSSPGVTPLDGTTASQTKSHSIYIPEEVSTDTVSGDIDGFFMGAGSTSLSTPTAATLIEGPSGIDVALQVTGATFTARDAAGFVAERPMFNNESSAQESLTTFESNISSAALGTFSNTGTLQISTGSSSTSSLFATYKVTLSQADMPTNLARSIADAIAKNSQSGTIVSWPSSLGGEPVTTAYQLFIGVSFFDSSDVVVMAMVVPDDVAGNYNSLISNTTQPTNISSIGAQATATDDTFTAKAGSGIADFLLVVDNSGSMGDDQQAVSLAAADFANVLANSGLDYRVATITTDSSNFNDTNADGGFTANTTEMENDVVVGTSGSATESGIYFAEEALSPGGSVISAGFPRANASLSLVMISDEDDQYCSYDSSFNDFSFAGSVFATNGSTVHSIINKSITFRNCGGDGYEDLSSSTQGLTADITDLTAISNTMTNIAVAAGGASSSFSLTHTPVASSIAVTVNGIAVAESLVNGWVYSIASNSINFTGTAIPEDGDTVKVSYSYF